MIINPIPENQCYKMMLNLPLNIAFVFGKIPQVVNFVFSKKMQEMDSFFRGLWFPKL
jgi:hypothetical protein